MTGLQLKYFVLSPLKSGPYGFAAREAMMAFAWAIEDEEPDLAKEVRDWVRDIEGDLEDE